MKVFVAGATGAIGRQLVPMLVRRGHEVVGMTRSESKHDLLAGLGAKPVVADALEPEAVGRAVSEAEPQVIVHELTAIPAAFDMRHIERDFAVTNRLRTEGTDHLLSAARAAGVRRFVAQSFASWFARSGGAVKSEDDPFDPEPPASVRSTIEAIRHLERAVTGADGIEGVVLRYGFFYGPGTSFSVNPPGALVEPIRKRRFPIVGNGAGVWSFVHIEDAAAATVDAVERGAPGVYHVVDDDPAPLAEWLPAAARAVGAKPPLRLPRWLGRLAAGEVAAVMLTEARGASNAKAERELGWRPRYPSWRQGFVEGLG
jgi:nucleoside-diphosphate-sugar epimerase